MTDHKNWLIVGGGGGIGRALTDLVFESAETNRIVATHRYPVSRLYERLEWITLDFEAPDAQNGADLLPADFDRIDYFVVCTGMLSAADIAPEKRLQDLEATSMQRSFAINAVGPLTTFAALSARIAAAPNPVAAFLSAQVGSIGDNGTGGWYSYRMAKAALNMGIKNLAIETGRWRNRPVVMAVHPGTTQSALSRPFTRRRRPPPRSAADTAARLHRLVTGAREAHHGRFITADGDPLPW